MQLIKEKDCFYVKRNPILIDEEYDKTGPVKPSVYNERKDSVLRSSRYQKIGEDDTLGFCYSSDLEMDYPDETIFDNWAEKKKQALCAGGG